MFDQSTAARMAYSQKVKKEIFNGKNPIRMYNNYI